MQSSSRSVDPGRSALTLVEVLIAVAVLAVLGMAVQTTMVQTLRGIAVDRESEMKRHVVQDLLERFCHPYSDIDSLFPPNTTVGNRQLTVDQALALIGMPAPERDLTAQILKSAEVIGFSLTWHRQLAAGMGDPDRALRLDRLVVKPVQLGNRPGATISSFRVFAIRGN